MPGVNGPWLHGEDDLQQIGCYVLVSNDVRVSMLTKQLWRHGLKLGDYELLLVFLNADLRQCEFALFVKVVVALAGYHFFSDELLGKRHDEAFIFVIGHSTTLIDNTGVEPQYFEFDFVGFLQH